MNIVVLCGGISSEREISLLSGKNICEGLRKKGHRAIILDVYLGRNDIDIMNPFFDLKSVEYEMSLINENAKNLQMLKNNRKEFFGDNVIEICKKCDIVFMALHGENGENGKVQAVFDLYSIKYTGAGVKSSSNAMDKGISRLLFSACGVPIARGCIVRKKDTVLAVSQLGLNFPVVIKPCCGGSSVGVYFANNDIQYFDGITKAFYYDDKLVIEEKILGREFSCGVIEYRALPVIEIVPKNGFYDYTNKYTKGNATEICPAKIPDMLKSNIQNIAEKAAKVLELDTYCRIDFMVDEQNRCYCLEANSLPGMTSISLLPQEALTLGIDFPTLCDSLINISIKDKV